MTKLRFFTFSQNHTGGVFDYAPGIGRYVIVQAEDAEDANRRAQAIGLYFDGWGDCDCCGNRWYSQWSEEKGTDRPEVWGCYVFPAGSTEDGFVHYADGEVGRFVL